MPPIRASSSRTDERSSRNNAQRGTDWHYDDMLTGINSVDRNASKESVRYSLDGRALKSPTKGINIIRKSDGTKEKVIVK